MKVTEHLPLNPGSKFCGGLGAPNEQALAGLASCCTAARAPHSASSLTLHTHAQPPSSSHRGSHTGACARSHIPARRSLVPLPGELASLTNAQCPQAPGRGPACRIPPAEEPGSHPRGHLGCSKLGGAPQEQARHQTGVQPRALQQGATSSVGPVRTRAEGKGPPFGLPRI